MFVRRAVDTVRRRGVRYLHSKYTFRLWQPSLNPRAARHRPQQEAQWDRWVPGLGVQPESYTITDMLLEHTEARPHKETFYVTHATEKLKWSMAEFRVRCEAVANAMLEMGYKKGMTVGVWAGNEAEVVTVFIAASMVGCRFVAIDPDLGTEGVRRVLENEDIRSLVFTQRWRKRHTPDVLSAIFPSLEDDRNIGGLLTSKRFRHLRHFVNIGQERARNVLNFIQMQLYNPDPKPVPIIRPYLHADQPFFTSIRRSQDDDNQFTQTPVLSVAQALDAARGTVEAANMTRHDTVVVTAPLFTQHACISGVLGALSLGAKVCLVNREFNASEALDALTKQRATVLVATTEQVAQMAEELKKDQAKPFPKYNLRYLRTGLVDTSFGGAPPEALESATLVGIGE